MPRARRTPLTPLGWAVVLTIGLLAGALTTRVGEWFVVGCSAAHAAEDDLAVALHRVPSTGKPDLATARRWAGLFRAHCARPWTAAAIALHTSGLRADAIGIDGVGLLGMHPRYTDVSVSLDPTRAIPAGCGKLAYWTRWHEREGCTGHGPVAHYAAGYRPGVRASGNERRVLVMLQRLCAAAGVAPCPEGVGLSSGGGAT